MDKIYMKRNHTVLELIENLKGFNILFRKKEFILGIKSKIILFKLRKMLKLLVIDKQKIKFHKCQSVDDLNELILNARPVFSNMMSDSYDLYSEQEIKANTFISIANYLNYVNLKNS